MSFKSNGDNFSDYNCEKYKTLCSLVTDTPYICRIIKNLEILHDIIIIMTWVR